MYKYFTGNDILRRDESKLLSGKGVEMLSQGMIVLDIVIGIITILLALGFLFVDINKKKRKELKCMSAKTVARELTGETIKEYDPNWKRFDTPSQKMDETKCSKYVFKADTKEYTGYGEVSSLGFSRNIKVRYDPKDPAKNCTEYEYRWETGIGEAIASLIIGGVIIFVPIILSLIIG